MRCFPLAVAGVIFAGFLSSCGTTKSVVHSVLPFTGKPAPATPGTAGKRTRNLSARMQLSPLPIKLSDSRQIDVRIRLENTSRKFVQLQFPTTQRIEIVVRDEAGKVIDQWSEDHLFEQTSGYVGINPGEHVEYTASIPTRDMQAGRRYVVEGFFPNFADLKMQTTVIPES